jgi:pimeloyl-ACP methyl ester carboxylesterase
VLFITGAWSEVLGASLQEQQMLLYPVASLKVVDGAGHDVAWIKTPEVLAEIRSYLDGLKGAIR